MPKFGTCVLLLSSLAAFAAAGCGSGGRHLQSMTVSPSTADAQTFSNGQVQFTATGHFNMTPMTVTPMAVTWSVTPMVSLPPGKAIINQNGMAQCQGLTGMTFTVTATAMQSSSDNMMMMGMSSMPMTATAQMMCP